MAFSRIARKNYMGACFARARKIFATARMLAFSFKGARLFEISLVLLYSYFLYINDISVMIWLRQFLKSWNILTFGVFNSSACNCCGRAACVIRKMHEAPQQVFRLLFYSLSYFIGAAGFLFEIGTVPLFRYMNFHILTCFSPSMGILRAHNMTGCELLGLVEPP